MPENPLLRWTRPAAVPQLGSAAVHVWALGLSPACSSAELQLLSAEERQRYAAFRYEKLRGHFATAHATLRQVLSAYLGVAAAELRFKRGRFGKPELSPEQANGVQSNLSHSGDMALIAVSRLTPVGVDVEEVHDLSDRDALVQRFFSPREAQSFLELEEAQRLEAFYRLWTRKEAWLKATGEGISHLLNRVEVSFLPAEPPEFRCLPCHGGAKGWRLFHLSPASRYTGALSVRGDRVLSVWSWPPVSAMVPAENEEVLHG